MPTHQLGVTWSTSGRVETRTYTKTADAENFFDVTIPANTTNQLVNAAITLARLRMLFMVADQAVVVKTNSSGSPQDTINLVANEPVIYVHGTSIVVPFAGNVTAIYLTNNPNANAGNFKLNYLQLSA